MLRKRRDAAAKQLETLKQLRERPATAQAITLAEITQQELLIQQLDAEIQHNQQKNLAAQEASELAIKAAQADLSLARLADTGIAAGDPAAVLDKTLALTRLTAAATSVQAPVDGEVLEIFVRPGERIANTPVLLMADLSEMICVAEVHESRLTDLLRESAEPDNLSPREPFSVVIHSDALDAELTGQVVEVGRLIRAPKLRDPNPLARSDVRTAQVKIALDAASCLVAQRFVNLQVDVTIQLKKGDDAK